MVKLLLVFLFSFSENLIFEEIDEETKFNIEYFSKNKIDINEALYNELISIPFINNEVVQEIIERRKKEKFKMIEELLTLQSVSPSLYLRIKDFFMISKEKRFRGKKSLLFKYIYPYPPDTSYSGSPSKIYLRANANINDFAFGFITEKDYYEKNYLDYYNLFFSYKKILIGGYDVSNGFGLLLGEQRFFYKFGGINEVNKFFKPHLSSSENNSYFGATIDLKFILPFFSYYKLDGNIKDSVFIPYFSGYHRTESEIEKKDKGKEIVFGTGIDLLNITGVLMYQKYEPFFPENARSYSFSFSTERKFRKTKFIFEFAKSNGYAFALGIKTPIGIQGLYRYFSDNFFSLRGGPLENKEGIYFFFERKILEFFTTFYTDFIKDSINYNNETGISLYYKPLKNINTKFTIKIKKEKVSGNSEFVFSEKLFNIRFKIFYNFLNDEKGYGTFFETGYNGVIDLKTRLTIYSTDSYQSAIYIYEDDLPGEYATIPYYLNGKNIYIFLRSDKFKIYFKTSIDIKEKNDYKVGLGIYL